MKLSAKRTLIGFGVLAPIVALGSEARAFTVSIDTGARAAEPLEVAALLTLVAIAPALVVMLTSFTRIVIVLVMAPTCQKIKSDALDPYLAGKLEPAVAIERAQAPLRAFMLRQTRREDVEMVRGLLAKAKIDAAKESPETLPFYALVIAFVSSELTAAFRVGFLVYLPFLAIDLVISSVLMALGMFMLPPGIISVPLKLLIFVMASGWPTLLGNLAASFT